MSGMHSCDPKAPCRHSSAGRASRLDMLVTISPFILIIIGMAYTLSKEFLDVGDDFGSYVFYGILAIALLLLARIAVASSSMSQRPKTALLAIIVLALTGIIIAVLGTYLAGAVSEAAGSAGDYRAAVEAYDDIAGYGAIIGLAGSALACLGFFLQDPAGQPEGMPGE